jgi:hypothetical protein
MPDPVINGSSQGQTITFGGTIGKVTDIDVSRSAGTIDTSDLTLADGDPRTFEPSQLLDGDEVKVDAIYATGSYPVVGASGALSTSLGAISGDAVCTQSTVTYSVGEVVKVSMSFKLGGTLD